MARSQRPVTVGVTPGVSANQLNKKPDCAVGAGFPVSRISAALAGAYGTNFYPTPGTPTPPLLISSNPMQPGTLPARSAARP